MKIVKKKLKIVKKNENCQKKIENCQKKIEIVKEKIEKNNLKKVDKMVLSTTKLLSNFSIKNLKITSVIILKKTI